MAINQPDRVESALVKSIEPTPFAGLEITSVDNQKLQELKVNATATLKDVGILPELAISNDLEYVQEKFKKIDASGDGHVTKDEINDYITCNTKLKPEEAAALQRVGAQIGKLEELSNDEFLDENDGVTIKDLAKANANAKAMNYAERNFDRMDGNGDGHVTKRELDGYARARGDQLSAEDQKNIEALKKNMGHLEEFSNDERGDENDGFTRNDLIKGRIKEGTAGLHVGGVDTPDGGSSAYGDLRPALDYAQKNFKQMDADGDKYISEDEIDQYMQENKLSTKEMQNLRALKQKVGNIEELSNDEHGDENNGISMKDIAKAQERIDISMYAQKNIDNLDGNGNGKVTEDEIEGYIRAKGDDISAEELRKLEALKRAVGDLEEKHNDEFGDENDGFTRYDLVDALNELGSAGARDDAQKPDHGERSRQKPEPRKREDDSLSAGDHEYTIQRGDSFWKIAKENLRAQNGTEPGNAEVVQSMKELAKANGMELTQTIYPGQKLRVPGPDKSGSDEAKNEILAWNTPSGQLNYSIT